MNLTSIPEVSGYIPSLAQWVKDPVLRWLWHRPAAAALIRTLAWELPYATGVALKRKKNAEIPFYLEVNSSAFSAPNNHLLPGILATLDPLQNLLDLSMVQQLKN